MSAYFHCWISPEALLGQPPEHRMHRWSPEDRAGVDIALSVMIEAFVTVDSGIFRPTRIGERTWLMKKVHVGHDCIIGDDVEIAPLSSIGGECVIADRVRIGQGAVTVPRITIGEGARIGAGAVVTKDVPAGETWVGNPADEISKQTRRRRALDALLERLDNERDLSRKLLGDLSRQLLDRSHPGEPILYEDIVRAASGDGCEISLPITNVPIEEPRYSPPQDDSEYAQRLRAAHGGWLRGCGI